MYKRQPLVRWRDATGTRHEQRTPTPGAFVSGLQTTIGEPDALEVVRPTLEDIYLGLIREHDAASAADPTADDSLTDLKEPA